MMMMTTAVLAESERPSKIMNQEVSGASSVVGSTSVMEAPVVLPSFFDVAVRADPSRVEHARRITKAWLSRRCLMAEDRTDVLVVVISELCTNAIVHGRVDEFGLRGRMGPDGRVRLEVRDAPSAVPSPQHVDSGAESGRGLLLVDAFITELGGAWGFTPDGATAWCEVPLTPARVGPAPLPGSSR
ncbi:ATP-binding protein [Streptomyces sp. NPDC002680]|uniref:ATP-binding protein n=1 Tax=Streptomyces sp. NPDC002680 TaxID=3364659 RepID=UPI0036B24607